MELTKDLDIYDAAGNIIGIADFRDLENYNIEEDLSTRKELREWGIENDIDSIMILLDSPVGEAMMLVFEPQGNGELGNFSTMCGNGIRAVASYLNSNYIGYKESFEINTLSGLRVVKRIGENFEVNMGEATFQLEDLQKYVNNFTNFAELLDIPISEFPSREVVNYFISQSFNLSGISFSIGLTGTRGEDGIDGEPHLVIKINSELDHAEIKKILAAISRFTVLNKKIFPLGINLNIVSTAGRNTNATFERNLGEHPDHAITAACGTGSTVVGVVILNHSSDSAAIENPGGVLTISKASNGNYMMLGPAVKLDSALI